MQLSRLVRNPEDRFSHDNAHFMCFFLQSGWSISMELVIGPEVGISYLTEKASTVSW